jgi:hypothetical protein
MRELWVAVLGAGLVMSGGAAMQAQAAPNGTQRMCRADRKAEKKTHKAEEKAAKNNAKAAREKVRAEERQDKASRAGEKIPGQMAAVQAPPM